MFTIREAFTAGRRQLQNHALKRRTAVKAPEPDVIATISEIFPEKGYGYLETPEGRQIYFHENSIIGSQFEKIKLGAQVHFVEEPGLKGPQASSVRVLKKPRTSQSALSK
jgi:cold shock CspA family protein